MLLCDHHEPQCARKFHFDVSTLFFVIVNVAWTPVRWLLWMLLAKFVCTSSFLHRSINPPPICHSTHFPAAKNGLADSSAILDATERASAYAWAKMLVLHQGCCTPRALVQISCFWRLRSPFSAPILLEQTRFGSPGMQLCSMVQHLGSMREILACNQKKNTTADGPKVLAARSVQRQCAP